MKLKLASGLDRVSPPEELEIGQDGFTKCRELQNYVVRNKRCKKIGGTEQYSAAKAGVSNIPWVHRSYHKRADDTFRKVVFCFGNGAIYSGNDTSFNNGISFLSDYNVGCIR